MNEENLLSKFNELTNKKSWLIDKIDESLGYYDQRGASYFLHTLDEIETEINTTYGCLSEQT